MKKGDIIIIVLVAIMIIASVCLVFALSGQGNTVTVKQNNKIVYSEKLSKDFTVTLDTNTVIIKDGTVYVSHATCKNQICVNSGKISKKGESIVCLPNKVIVEIN